MINRNKKLLFAVFTAILTCQMFSAVSYGNSAPVFVSPGDAARGVIPREVSPLIVEKEILTFDIRKLEPEDRGYDISEAIDRSGTVTAQYYFQNPTKETVTTRLAFAQGIDRVNPSCEVRINDTSLETKVRYTYIGDDENFHGPEDVKKIQDAYYKDAFYDPEMPVTEYAFHFTGLPEKQWVDAIFAYTIPDASVSHILTRGRYDEAGYYATSVANDEDVLVYVLGETEGVEFSWTAEGDISPEPEVGREMTLEEFAVLSTEQIPDITKEDSYNVIVSAMKAREEQGMIRCHLPEADYDTTMWIEYEFTLGPEESAVNTVKAVLAPEVYDYRKKPEYTYHYLLSPAQSWKKFGTLDVQINTGFDLYDPDGKDKDYTQTENGFTRHFDSLPDGELEFSLTRKPEKKESIGSGLFGFIGYLFKMIFVQ